MSENGDAQSDVAHLQQQINDMKQLMQLQLESLTMQTELMNRNNPSEPSLAINHVKNVKVPEGRYDMNPNEFRTYRKDCVDYKLLTKYTDKQVVLQMRLNMDSQLKRAVDTNFAEDWDEFNVNQAVEAIGKIMNRVSNPIVYRKEFDGMKQNDHESITEFITRLKTCAMDCNFVCPFSEDHDLTEYHIISRIRCEVANKRLQQELLQKSEDLDSLKDILQFCQNYEVVLREPSCFDRKYVARRSDCSHF